MFDSKKKKSRSGDVNTLIGQEATVLGGLRFSGGLHVDGRVEGDVQSAEDTTATLTVGPTGVVEGNVEAPHIVIDGLVTGDVRALESIELEPNARVNGNIYYQRIEMAMGAEVNGNLVHVAADTQEAAVEVPEGNPPEQ